jgi:hypothetical protein
MDDNIFLAENNRTLHCPDFSKNWRDTYINIIYKYTDNGLLRGISKGQLGKTNPKKKSHKHNGIYKSRRNKKFVPEDEFRTSDDGPEH